MTRRVGRDTRRLRQRFAINPAIPRNKTLTARNRTLHHAPPQFGTEDPAYALLRRVHDVGLSCSHGRLLEELLGGPTAADVVAEFAAECEDFEAAEWNWLNRALVLSKFQANFNVWIRSSEVSPLFASFTHCVAQSDASQDESVHAPR